jgi:lipopolysaccharide/colanic/teichoic acid biosynthesis glycosyltransferase
MQIELVESTEVKQQSSTQRALETRAQGLASGLSSTHDRRRYYFASKRLLDVLIAAILLIAFAPLILVIAIMIKLDSPGPVIFKQQRVGARRRKENGRDTWEIGTFTFYKFRSMKKDADSELHRAFVKAFMDDDDERMADIQRACREKVSEPHDAFSRAFLPDQERARKLTYDPRATSVGRILRKTSLDEVPQFWNVLKGEMSLVGPRPDLPYSVAEYKPWHFERLNAKPGITGLWQVKGRSEVSWDDFVRMDIEYVQNQSLWLDLKILLKTPLAVLRGEGAA